MPKMPSSSDTQRPRIILGLMTFSPDINAGGRITTLEEFHRCLNYFQAQGYSEIDTARMYLNGKQEEFTAAAGWKERGLTIATKVYPSNPGFHKRDSLRQKFSESLAALQTDSVDIFYLHAADRSVPFSETLEAVNEMYEEGKFRRLRLSNYTAFEVAEIVTMCVERGWVRPTIYQAMAIVHSSGQYHMDLKPSNVFLNNEDDVIVIDWEQCGASPFFLAPEGNGLWDVEVVANSETGIEPMMPYQKFIGPLPDNCGTWPRRNAFQLWQRECPRALEAAEVYSIGRSLWVIFEQRDDVWVHERGHPEAKAVVWTHASDSMPEIWKDFVSRCMSLDPNKRPTFEQGERFWGQEWKQLEGNTK
ncbi:NADP-dependent oxidoreductase domain-containing protein [Trichoderma evansii]